MMRPEPASQPTTEIMGKANETVVVSWGLLVGYYWCEEKSRVLLVRKSLAVE